MAASLPTALEHQQEIGDIWAVTKWLIFAGMGTFLLRKSDEVLAARVGTTAEYGTYNAGADLGTLTIDELGPAMMRAFLPELTSMKDDAQRTSRVVVKTLAAVNAIMLHIEMGEAALAVPITGLLLVRSGRQLHLSSRCLRWSAAYSS